jgi:hypothetical protein
VGGGSGQFTVQPVSGYTTAHGSFTISDSTIFYTPTAGYIGTDQLQYRISCNGESGVATVYISVTERPDNIVDSDCNGTPPMQEWGIQEIPINKNKLIHNYGPLVTGDIDNDGVTEIIGFVPHTASANGYESGGLRIFTMNSGAVQFKKDIPFTGHMSATFGGMAMARYNNVGYIVVCGVDRYLYAYNAVTNVKIWQSNALATASAVGSIVNIADFNGDGIPEVYAGNKIFSLSSGNLLCDGGANNTGVLVSSLGHSTIAADITGDGNLELCAGTQIYRVTIPQGATTSSGCSMGLISDMELPAGSLHANAAKDGATQVADIDNDGQLEIVVISNSSSRVVAYVWKPLPANASHLLGSYLVPATGVGHYAIPMIGNIDNTPYPEIVFITNGTPLNMYALKYDPAQALGSRIDLKWTLTHTDGSGCTGASLFDFDQNGMNEIVYRDQTQLRIIDGSGGSAVAKNTFANVISGTLRELPVIADVDGDGQAEIIIQGWDNVALNVDGINASGQNGYLRVFKSPTKWAPARKVWNQYAYNAVNINEDLTVPLHQLNPATEFPNGKRPFNNFLQQQTSLNTDGDPLWLLPDLVLTSTPATEYHAAGDSIIIKNICIRNDGDARSADNLSIALYRDSRNPSNLLQVYTVPGGINVNDTRCYRIKYVGISAITASALHIEINDNGTSARPQIECDSTTSNGGDISFASIPIARNDRFIVFSCKSKTANVLTNDLNTGGNSPSVIKDGKLGTASPSGTNILYENNKSIDGGCSKHGGRRDTVVYRICSGSNCSEAIIVVDILRTPAIKLVDSCSRHPYLTVNYQYPAASYQWYKSSDKITWTPIGGSPHLKLYVTEDAWYKVAVTYNGDTVETDPVHFIIHRKSQLPGNLWWYDSLLTY